MESITLSQLTSCKKGFVIYDHEGDNYSSALICNWSEDSGLPFELNGVLYFRPYEFFAVPHDIIIDLFDLFQFSVITSFLQEDIDALSVSGGKLYHLEDDIHIFVPFEFYSA